MHIRRQIGAAAGAFLVILFAGYARGETGTTSNDGPPAARLEQVEPFAAARTTSGIDLNSVKCTHAWALVTKAYLDRCNPDGDTELKADLDYEITITAEFLIINSSHAEVMKQDLERETLNSQAAMASLASLVCSAGADDHQHGWMMAYSNALRAIPSNERRAGVAKLLTVPGPALRMCAP